jgi:Flp pilus assembly protein TadD
MVGGLVAEGSGTRVALCTLGVALVVLAVVLTRLEGPLEIGPSGIKATMRARREVVQRSEAVEHSMSESGLDLRSLATGRRSLDDLPESGRERIETEASALAHAIEQLDTKVRARESDVPSAALREVARASMAAGNWAEAARYLDRYVRNQPNDWEAQFSRAVAHANSRADADSDLSALQAYNEAITLRPANTEPNLVARLLSYRGAMLKRLGRLAEAEADLNVARTLATEDYERNDIKYNLACVYAMTNRRDEAIALIRELRSTGFITPIRANAGRYFKSLVDDPEFMTLVGAPASA